MACLLWVGEVDENVVTHLRLHYAVEVGDAFASSDYTHVVVGKGAPNGFLDSFEIAMEDKIERPALIGYCTSPESAFDAVWLKETPLEEMLTDVSRLNTDTPSVLVVDDSSTTRLISQAVLKGFGLNVQECSGGRAALSVIASQRISAALIDIEMPDLDGISTVREIRKLPRYRSTPLVALTAHEGDGTREKCLEAGYSAYLHKPFNQAALKSLFGQALAGGRATIAPPPMTVASDDNLVVVEDPDIADLFPGFLESRFLDCISLNDAIRDNSYEKIRGVAHRSKGASATYSFPTLTRLSSEIGRLARACMSSEPEMRGELLDAINSYITHLQELEIKTSKGVYRAIDFKPS